jgi:hypothetical protein
MNTGRLCAFGPDGAIYFEGQRQLIVLFTVTLEKELKSVLGAGWALQNDFRRGILTRYKESRARKGGWGRVRNLCLQTHKLNEVSVGFALQKRQL